MYQPTDGRVLVIVTLNVCRGVGVILISPKETASWLLGFASGSGTASPLASLTQLSSAAPTLGFSKASIMKSAKGVKGAKSRELALASYNERRRGYVFGPTTDMTVSREDNLKAGCSARHAVAASSEAGDDSKAEKCEPCANG